MKYLKYILPAVIVGLLIAGGVHALSVSLPASVKKGDLLVGSSTNASLYTLPTSTQGSVLWVASTGLPAWTATSTLGISGGSGTPGGADTQLQYNNAGAFGGISQLTWNGSLLQNTATTTLASTTISSLTLGNGVTSTFLAANASGLVTATTTPILTNTTIVGGGTATGPAFTFATSTDTNLLIQIVCATSTCTFTPQWTGTLAAARLNANVVQAITNDTNVTGSISSQNLTLGWTGQLAVGRGGTGSSTLVSNGVIYGNGTSAVLAALGTSGQVLMANGSAVPTFTTFSGDITVNSTGVTAIGASKVTNAMLAGSITAAKLVGTDIATVGTITSGTWQGTVVGSAYGGTGTNTLASLLVGSNLSVSGGQNVLIGTSTTISLGTNVVTSAVNDTNVTGSIASNALTLGWTGTLAAARLNSNVVQAITNDTNVTGSIAAQNLTLGWTGVQSVTRGGTATSTAPTVTGQLLMADGTGAKYQPGNLVAGSNITITTSTPGQITIASTGGGGGSGNSAWTIDNAFIYNATSTDAVLVGTSTNASLGTLSVQGNGGINPFSIASSTGTSLLTVTQAGNVGISTTTPTAKLAVTGTAGNNPAFVIASSTNAVQMIVTAAGNVGIGNSAPASTLELGTSTNSLRLNSGAAVTGPSIRASSGNLVVNGGNILYLNIDAGGDIYGYGKMQVGKGNVAASTQFEVQGVTTTIDPFNVGSSTGASILRVTRTHRVGINTTTPLGVLVVQGTSTFPTINPLIVASSTGTGLLVITPAGNVGIGTSTPNATLHNYGSVALSYTTTNASSYTIATSTDNIIYAASSTAAQTLTLPNCVGATDQVIYTIKDSSGAAATQNKTIARAGTDTIDGATSKVINTNYGVARVQCVIGGTWFILGN